MVLREVICRCARRAGALVVVAAVLFVACGSEPQTVRRPIGTDESSSSPKLYLAGDGELWVVDLSGDVRHVELAELGPGDPPHRLVRRGDQLVAWGYETYLLDPELRAKPHVLVADSWFFIPSAHEDRIWVAILDPQSPDTERALKAVREVTVDGRVTVPDTRPPDGRWPERALDQGLLLPSRGEPHEWVVWDPVSERVRFRFDPDHIGPTHGSLIASCDDRCESLRITDVATGEEKTIGAPGGFGAFNAWLGDFSPDGSLLAIPVRRDPEAVGGQLTLAVIDVFAGTARIVDGASVDDGYNFVSWSASGDYVFFTGGQRFEERTILAYRMGDARAHVLPVEVGDFYGAAAI
jgi:hypothetical protein